MQPHAQYSNARTSINSTAVTIAILHHPIWTAQHPVVLYFSPLKPSPFAVGTRTANKSTTSAAFGPLRITQVLPSHSPLAGQSPVGTSLIPCAYSYKTNIQNIFKYAHGTAVRRQAGPVFPHKITIPEYPGVLAHPFC